MIQSVLHGSHELREKCEPEMARRLERVMRMLQRLVKMQPGLDGRSKKAVMREAIWELTDGGTSSCTRFYGRLLVPSLSWAIMISVTLTSS